MKERVSKGKEREEKKRGGKEEETDGKIKIQSALHTLKSRPHFLGSTGERARVRSSPE